MFNGSSFIFDEIPSEVYDLRILNLTMEGTGESPAGGSVNLLQSWPLKRNSPFHFGVSNNVPLEFQIEVGSYDPRTTIDRSRIERWLIGRNQYKKFQIATDDMMDVYFNVIFQNAGNLYVGNVFQGISLSATCDAPWGWTFPRTKTLTFDGDVLQDYNFNFYNDSDDQDGYLYPTVAFTLSDNVNSTDFTLTNASDSNRSFQFTGLTNGETITVDNDRKIITSSLNELRLADFNKNWFRLAPGKNILNIAGYLESFSMTYSFARKIGG